MLRDQLNWQQACEPPHACVQIAKAGDRVFLRDSKDPDGDMLSFDEGEIVDFANFVGPWLKQQ